MSYIINPYRFAGGCSTEGTPTHTQTNSDNNFGARGGVDELICIVATSTSVLVGEKVAKLGLSLKDGSAASGTIVFGVWDVNGTELFRFGTHDASTLTGSYAWIEKENTDAYTIQSDDRIGLLYEGPVQVDVEYQSGSNDFDGTDTYVAEADDVSSPTWTDRTGDDLKFRLYKCV